MTNFEIDIVNKIRETISPAIEKIFELLTYLGGQEILILIVVIVYFVFSKRIGQRIAFTVFGSLLVNNSLKVIVNRARPFNHDNATYDVGESVRADSTGQSFPSGHSQNSAVTYTSIAINAKRKSIWIVSSIIIVLVGFSRIVLGVHYPSDVIVGIILGVLLAYVGTKLHEKVEDNFLNQMKLYLIVAIIFLPVLLIYIPRVKTNFNAYKDLYTIYSFYIGYIVAVFLEKKYVDFDENIDMKIKVIRSIVAIVIILILMIGLKSLFPKENIIFDMIRYFSLSFIGLGIYPLLTKNIFFKKNSGNV